MVKPIKIAIINTHPITYFSPLYRYINQHSGIEVTVIYFSNMGICDKFDQGFNQSVTTDLNLLNGFNFLFCGKNYNNKTPRGFFSIITPEIWKTIRQSDYDVIWFHGYNHAAFILAFVASILSKKIIFFRSETHLRLKRVWLKQQIRDNFLKFFFKFIDGFLAIGSLNKSYYERIGVPNAKITLVPYAVDNVRFGSCSTDMQTKKIYFSSFQNVSANLPTILYCAKFIPRKNPNLLLRAFKILQQRGHSANLIMVGNGPELENMKSLANRLDLDNVCFTGFLGQTKLPQLFTHCDLFVHPSEDEPWALVVNEAMAAGLPVIVSKDVGCAEDIVVDEVNGLKLTKLTPEHLANSIIEIVSDSKKLKKMSKASRTIINQWNFDKCLDGIISNLKKNGFEIS